MNLNIVKILARRRAGKRWKRWKTLSRSNVWFGGGVSRPSNPRCSYLECDLNRASGNVLMNIGHVALRILRGEFGRSGSGRIRKR